MVEDCRVPCIASFGRGFFKFSPKMKRSAWLLLALFSLPFAGTCVHEMGSTARYVFALGLGMLVAPFTIINRRLACFPWMNIVAVSRDPTLDLSVRNA